MGSARGVLVIAGLALLAAWAPAAGGDADVGAAAVGDLTQKAGLAGCVSHTGAGGCFDGRGLDGAASVALSPDGTSAYAATAESDAVAIFDRAADGTLTQKAGVAGCIAELADDGCADGRTLRVPTSLVVSPDGANVYAASNFEGIAVFDRAADGTLTQKPGAAGCVEPTGTAGCTAAPALDTPTVLTISPDGQSVYVGSVFGETIAVLDRAPGGALTPKAGAAGCVSESGAAPCLDGHGIANVSHLAVSGDGMSVYSTSSISDAVAVFTRAADGSLSQATTTAGCVSHLGGGGCASGRALENVSSAAVSSDNQNVYVTAEISRAVAVFDRAANGTLTQKPGAAGCISSLAGSTCAVGTALHFADALALSPDGRSAYAGAAESDSIVAFTRAGDGTLTQAGCVSETGASGCVDGRGLDGAGSVAVAPGGDNVYVAARNSEAVAVFDREDGPDVPGSCDGKPATIDLNHVHTGVTVTGTKSDDVIVTGAGNDIVRGGTGNDTICTGDGLDTAQGDAGDDALFGGDAADKVKGGAGNDRLSGGDGADAVDGGAGADTLRGDAGDDKLNGGDSEDGLIGGAGGDLLAGGGGVDRCAGDDDGGPALPGRDRTTAANDCETVVEVP